jgi:hypothetical protein
MVLPAAVGANLWLVTVLLPLVLERSWVLMPGAGLAALFLMVLLPPAALAIGLRRRSRTALLVAFPFLCMLPELLLTGRAEKTAPTGPAPLVLVAAVLLGYLFACAHALSRGPAAEAVSQPLPSTMMPPRWRRRLRMYRTMVIAAALFPAALLFWLLGWPATRDAFDASFASASGEALTAATAGVGLAWLGLYRAYFVAPLDGHLHHDREMRVQIEVARRHARRGRPRPLFYLAVVAALAAMGAVLWSRMR